MQVDSVRIEPVKEREACFGVRNDVEINRFPGYQR